MADEVEVKELLDKGNIQPSRNTSTKARADQVVKANHIGFVPNLHAFNVKGTSGMTRVVTLYPREI